jgi:DNA-binding winged helix-turn-helix (wHTH) protein/TolB-like protein
MSIALATGPMVDRPIPGNRSYLFGPFRLDVSSQQLYRGNEPVDLTRRLFRVLHLLVENHGKDLDKSYLMDQLWPDTVVEENNLTVIISMLRKALGDGVDQKKYILTNPGRGYRFVAKVVESGPEVKPDPSVPPSFPQARSAPLNAWRKTIFLATGLSFFFLLLAGFTVWQKRTQVERIAVLPFQPLGTDNDDSYLGLGMADALIARLRSIRGVTVVPTAEIIKYQNRAHDAAAIGRDLKVLSVLDGTVERNGDDVWLRVKLVRARDGTVLWSDDYRGKFAQILTMQDQIADRAISALAVKLNSEEQQKIRKHSTTSDEAYQRYIAGRYYCTVEHSEVAAQKGIAALEQATEKDPRFALAYTTLAGCYLALAELSEAPPRESWLGAEKAAQAAIDIDPSLPDAYLPLAQAETYYHWDFKAAERAFRKGIELAPDDPAAHVNYAVLLVSLGRSDEALHQSRMAAELDPYSWSINGELSTIYFLTRRYREAAERWEKAREISTDDPPWFLGWIYASEGRDIPMIDEVKKAQQGDQKPLQTAALGYLYALKKMKTDAEHCLRKLEAHPEKVDGYELALIYAALEENDKAFHYLESAKNDRSESIIFLRVDPRLETLHSDPRFKSLLKQIHLDT